MSNVFQALVTQQPINKDNDGINTGQQSELKPSSSQRNKEKQQS